MMVEEPNIWPWIAGIGSSLFVGAVSFVLGMTGFKAQANAQDKFTDKEIALMQKDISRLESNKADNDKILVLQSELKRIDNAKAEKEIVAMLVQQIQGMDSKLTKILSRLPEH